MLMNHLHVNKIQKYGLSKPRTFRYRIKLLCFLHGFPEDWNNVF